MLASQRQLKILERVAHHGAARVGELARQLDVAEETIRRDLKLLADRGALIRTHGGALPKTTQGSALDQPAHERSFSQRSVEHAEAKQAIAERALDWIKPGMVIALDASSTAVELAKLLPDRPLTVVTNGLPAEDAVGRFNIELCFCSCMGIDPKRGMSEVDVPQASIKLRMIESAARTVLLADDSKFGVSSHVFTASAAAVDTLITNASDRPEAAAVIESLSRDGLEVVEVGGATAVSAFEVG